MTQDIKDTLKALNIEKDKVMAKRNLKSKSKLSPKGRKALEIALSMPGYRVRKAK